MQMIRVYSTFLFLLFVSCLYAGSDIIIADFEGSDYGNWKVEGEAFGHGPARGTLPGQMEVTGFIGKRLVNTFYKGDTSKGTLTSPEFKIQKKFINFLIGGGKHPGGTCMNLLLGGKVVRTATGPNGQPGGSERLRWSSWEVSEFIGKTARIKIIDNETGGWGHINIDQVVQSDKKIVQVDLSRKMVFKKHYLNLPVKTSAQKHYLDIIIDGKIVREFDLKLTGDKPDYWVYLDLSEFQGKTATIRMPGSFGLDSALLKGIFQADGMKGSEKFYTEKKRQQFHFSARRGWNNDPNGLVYYKGEYHLFFQHNPYGWGWGNMTWGHAVSKDLVHWTELSDAIHPGKLGTIFSGSAVVDNNNTTGFQVGDEKPIVCVYSIAGGANPMSRGQPFTMGIAYSIDRGRTWTTYKDNPVQGHINGSNRDPKAFWYAPASQWVIVVYLDGGEMGFFTSKNLKKWKFHSKLKCFHECPELFPLPLDGKVNNQKWILYGGSGQYLVGAFDGKKFTPETKSTRFNFGNCFYASQTYNNIPEEDGRRIQIAWGRSSTPGMPFNQCMLFPCRLTLHKTGDGLRLFAYPVKEIGSIHIRKYEWKNQLVKGGENLLDGIRGELFDIDADVTAPPSVTAFGFNIRGTEVLCDLVKGQLHCRGCNASIKNLGRRLQLRILVDRTTIEIYLDNGRIYMPVACIPPDDNLDLKFFTRGGSVKIEKMEIFKLKSAWPIGSAK